MSESTEVYVMVEAKGMSELIKQYNYSSCMYTNNWYNKYFYRTLRKLCRNICLHACMVRFVACNW
jgi:hypothetical protein